MAATDPTANPRPRHTLSTGRRGAVAGALAATVAAGSLLLLVAPSASAANPGSRTPGTPVAQSPVYDQSAFGGTNPKVGTVPSTQAIGVPDPGVVPVVGNVAAQADDGAYVLYESQLTRRVVDLMISSPAAGGAMPVRVQLPPTWYSKPSATFPSVYLLHGGADKAGYQSWSLYSTEWQTTKATNALVVMPSIGSAAYATNFWNFGLGGSKQYNTFVSTELPQILQRGYRANGRAAIAGLSSGGSSALALAAQHPGEYGATASFSGVDDTQLPLVAQTIEFGALTNFEIPLAQWGDAIVNFPIWSANNPAALVARLRGTKVFVSCGNGNAGPLDSGTGGDPYEPIALASANSFLGAAKSAGVPVTSDLYGAGTHSWPYWGRELARAWPQLRSGVGLSS